MSEPAVSRDLAPSTSGASVTPSEGATILSMIERAARDPSVDLDKMERLMRMKRETQAEQAERAFNMAMKSAQAEMRPIGANATNSQTKSKYATYDKLDRALRPIYTKHGFSLSFDESDSDKPEHIRVVCYVAHDDGHTRTYRKDMPADGKGAKGGDVMTKTHATGAAASYGARYLLKGIFNVAIGEEDKDGNRPDDTSVIDDRQAERIRALATEVKADIGRFLAFLRVESIPDIPASRYDAAVRALEAKRGRQ